ncbi:MAG: iron-sulfur cluster assembly scaffold protein, partial [Gammaproteobacteria bacterium]
MQPPPLYHADIIELSRGNINAGVLPNAPMAKQTNPWCGDECLISATFDGGRIVQSLHRTRGCILCLAAAAKATTMAMQLGDVARVLQLAEAFAKMMRGEGEMPESLALFAPV